MCTPFFEHPILNSPDELPQRHWELDTDGQPTQRIVETRRRAEFISPIPKPKKRKGLIEQQQIVFDEGKGLSTEAQQYEQTSLINAVRHEVVKWRALPNPNTWQVKPETARRLQPNDPESYYKSRELVPNDMLVDVERVKMVITNYHAFKLRERLELSKGGRSLLQGRGEALNTIETEGQMVTRVMPRRRSPPWIH